jgi:hypothetical protein
MNSLSITINDITCDERGQNVEHGIDLRYYEFTTDGKVWPCALWVSLHLRFDIPDQPQYRAALLDDPEFRKLYDNDPDWNNINKHDIDSIINSDFFTKYVNIDGWGSECPPFVCQLFCKKGSRGMKGYAHKPDSDLDKKN